MRKKIEYRQLFNFSLSCSERHFPPQMQFGSMKLLRGKSTYMLSWNKISSFTAKNQKNNMLWDFFLFCFFIKQN